MHIAATRESITWAARRVSVADRVAQPALGGVGVEPVVPVHAHVKFGQVGGDGDPNRLVPQCAAAMDLVEGPFWRTLWP